VYVSVTKFKLNYGHLEFVVYILLLFAANIMYLKFFAGWQILRKF